MKKTGEIANFRKYFIFYIAGFLVVMAYTVLIGYYTFGLVTLELLVGAMFMVFLGVIVYLGSLIIELDRKIEILNKKIEAKKDK